MSKNKSNSNNGNNNDSNDMNNPIVYNDIITLLSLCDNDMLQGNDDINTNANIIKLKKTISHKFSSHYILSQSFGGSSSGSSSSTSTSTSSCSNNNSSGGSSSNDNDNMNSVNDDNNNKMDIATSNNDTKNDTNETTNDTKTDITTMDIVMKPEIMIDINEVTAIYKAISTSKVFTSLSSIMLDSLECLTKVLQEKANTFDKENPSLLKPFIILLEYPLLLDPIYQVILRNLSAAVNKLPQSGKWLLYEWIRDHAGEERYLKYICIFRQFMTLRIFVGVIEDARLATKVLGILFSAIESYPNVSFLEFYNDALNEEYMRLKEGRMEEFKRWKYDLETKRHTARKEQVGHSICFGTDYRSFISYPFVLSSAIKVSILSNFSLTIIELLLILLILLILLY